eukprot:jgi/Chrzof1/13623/Cz08g04160.t1
MENPTSTQLLEFSSDALDLFQFLLTDTEPTVPDMYQLSSSDEGLHTMWEAWQSATPASPQVVPQYGQSPMLLPSSHCVGKPGSCEDRSAGQAYHRSEQSVQAVSSSAHCPSPAAVPTLIDATFHAQLRRPVGSGVISYPVCKDGKPLPSAGMPKLAASGINLQVNSASSPKLNAAEAQSHKSAAQSTGLKHQSAMRQQHDGWQQSAPACWFDDAPHDDVYSRAAKSAFQVVPNEVNQQHSNNTLECAESYLDHAAHAELTGGLGTTDDGSSTLTAVVPDPCAAVKPTPGDEAACESSCVGGYMIGPSLWHLDSSMQCYETTMQQTQVHIPMMQKPQLNASMIDHPSPQLDGACDSPSVNWFDAGSPALADPSHGHHISLVSEGSVDSRQTAALCDSHGAGRGFADGGSSKRKSPCPPASQALSPAGDATKVTPRQQTGIFSMSQLHQAGSTSGQPPTAVTGFGGDGQKRLKTVSADGAVAGVAMNSHHLSAGQRQEAGMSTPRSRSSSPQLPPMFGLPAGYANKLYQPKEVNPSKSTGFKPQGSCSPMVSSMSTDTAVAGVSRPPLPPAVITSPAVNPSHNVSKMSSPHNIVPIPKTMSVASTAPSKDAGQPGTTRATLQQAIGSLISASGSKTQGSMCSQRPSVGVTNTMDLRNIKPNDLFLLLTRGSATVSQKGSAPAPGNSWPCKGQAAPPARQLPSPTAASTPSGSQMNPVKPRIIGTTMTQSLASAPLQVKLDLMKILDAESPLTDRQICACLGTMPPDWRHLFQANPGVLLTRLQPAAQKVVADLVRDLLRVCRIVQGRQARTK